MIHKPDEILNTNHQALLKTNQNILVDNFGTVYAMETLVFLLLCKASSKTLRNIKKKKDQHFLESCIFLMEYFYLKLFELAKCCLKNYPREC